MASPTSPFTDHAAPILAEEPTINDEQRADLWDAFHTKNVNELVQHLQPLAVPEDFKKRFWQAKQQAIPPIEPIDKVTAVMQKMTELDPKVLDLAESHPNVLKTLTTAATTPEKGAESASGASKPAPKGKKAEADTAPLVQPPRPDGLEHLPPIDPAHYRVLASDGGIHDLPKENIEKARTIDPRLHILNP